MLILKYIILGIIQGITEPLPISSSGHLVLAKSLINIETQGSVVELLVHFGSLLAILLYYRKDILDLFFRQSSFFLMYKIIIIVKVKLIKDKSCCA